MNATNLHERQRIDTVGSLSYLDNTVVPSLYRNGRVLTHRDRDGSDADTRGLNYKRRTVPVRDARQLNDSARLMLRPNGFELFKRPLITGSLDFLDQDQILRSYYDECAALVGELTGGHAFAFDHNVRSATGKKNKRWITGGQQVQGPVYFVHGDYTLTSAPQRLRDLGQPPTGNDTLQAVLGAGASLISADCVERILADHGRFAFINVWRNIADTPVVTNPIALCDAQTVQPEDLVVFEIHYQDRIGENYFARHASAHHWYYYPCMTRDEVLLIKQWDSAGPLARSDGTAADDTNPSAPCTFSFHSAFDDAATPPDAPDRWSIEVRCVVLYD
jgi:hypothetical protein